MNAREKLIEMGNDRRGSMLNIQPGFDEVREAWKCYRVVGLTSFLYR